MSITDWISIGTSLVLLLTGVFILFQAFYTRRLVTATLRSFVDGNVQISLVPYGAKGALNLRVMNIGASTANNVTLEFPCGLLRIAEGAIEDASETGIIPMALGSLGPGEKREWFLFSTSSDLFDKLPRYLQYTVRFKTNTRRKAVNHAGQFDLHSYRGSLIRAYVGIGDIQETLEDVAQKLGKLSGVQPKP